MTNSNQIFKLLLINKLTGPNHDKSIVQKKKEGSQWPPAEAGHPAPIDTKMTITGTPIAAKPGHRFPIVQIREKSPQWPPAEARRPAPIDSYSIKTSVPNPEKPGNRSHRMGPVTRRIRPFGKLPIIKAFQQSITTTNATTIGMHRYRSRHGRTDAIGNIEPVQGSQRVQGRKSSAPAPYDRARTPDMIHSLFRRAKRSSNVVRHEQEQGPVESARTALISKKSQSQQGSMPEISVQVLADKIYGLIVDRVKRERAMRGF